MLGKKSTSSPTCCQFPQRLPQMPEFPLTRIQVGLQVRLDLPVDLEVDLDLLTRLLCHGLYASQPSRQDSQHLPVPCRGQTSVRLPWRQVFRGNRG